MFSILSIASIALLAASSVSGLVLPRTPTATPASYNVHALEAYGTYHARYLALNCENKHNTEFFATCCHPLHKGQTNTNAECKPTSGTSSADDGNDDDCADDNNDPTSTTIPTATLAAKPTTTHHTTTKTTAKTTAKTTTTHKAVQTGSSSSGSNTGGFATFFFQNGVAGACGTVHKDTDFIAAIDQDRYGDSGLKSALCGKQVRLTNTKNGKSVTVTIQDDCPTCKNGNSIDLSKSAFEAIATLDEGMVPIDWDFV